MRRTRLASSWPSADAPAQHVYNRAQFFERKKKKKQNKTKFKKIDGISTLKNK
jgi:hypothetical protein